MSEAVVPENVEIKSMDVMRLFPGDILVYIHPNYLTKTQHEKVAEQLRQMIPEGVNLAILDGGARFGIIRKEVSEEVEGEINGEREAVDPRQDS